MKEAPAYKHRGKSAQAFINTSKSIVLEDKTRTQTTLPRTPWQIDSEERLNAPP
ncbi:hypothetical protein AVEN_91238-1, partial [Araneus ventricosus]